VTLDSLVGRGTTFECVLPPINLENGR